MYTKSRLESMTFKELKRLARDMSISQRWTCKREAVNHLMGVGYEDLKMVTVALVDSPHLPNRKPRFPKPRMTVFQQDKDDSLSTAESSHKGNQKYFATPSGLRSKANENFRYSAREPAFEAVASSKRSLTPSYTNAGKIAVTGVSLREHGRPLTRSYKNRLLHMELSQCGEEHNPVADETIHSSEKVNSNSGGMFKNIKLNKSVSVSGTTKVHKREWKYPLSCGREQQINISTGEMKVTSDARMEDVCLTLTQETGRAKTDTEESSPKFNLNETFVIENETAEVTPPSRMEGCNRTSTPTDDTDDKENEISGCGSMNTIFELPCQSNASSCAYNMENNKSAKKKESLSCPYVETDREGLSKTPVLSQTTKLTTPYESHLCHVRGTPLKRTKIPKLAKKMPDFTNIHKREFEKMESVVDCYQRKLDRAKMFQFSKSTPGVQPVMFTAQLSATKQTPSSNLMTQKKVCSTSQMTRSVPQRSGGDRDVSQHTRAYNRQLIRHDIKEMVMKKVPLQKIQRVREETRTVIRGVRLNRRFDLQMAHRRMN